MSAEGYTPTEAEVREAVAEWMWSRRMWREEVSRADGHEVDRYLAVILSTPPADDVRERIQPRTQSEREAWDDGFTTATASPPADGVREAAQTFAEHVGWNWDALTPMWRERFEQAAQKVLDRPRGTVTVDEPEFEYCVLNGLGYGIYMAMTLNEARMGISKDQRVGPGQLRPERSIMRRRRAGAWEHVDSTPSTS